MRCRDCKYWKVRWGCINKEVIKANGGGLAIIPPKYEVYKKTNCPYFENKGGLK